MDPAQNVGQIHDVQELNKARNSQVPNRFVRDDKDRPEASRINLSKSIPVVDLSKIQKGTKDEFLQLVHSCEHWGFFQVINHGVDLGLLERMEKMAMGFFMLPLEEKRRYPMNHATVQGYGQAFVFSEDQKLDWCNMFALGLEPRSIRDPKLWPSNPAKFSETLEEYSKEIRKVCKKLLEFIAISLKLDANVFEQMFGGAVQAARMNYYPACPRPDLVNGLSPPFRWKCPYCSSTRERQPCRPSHFKGQQLDPCPTSSQCIGYQHRGHH